MKNIRSMKVSGWDGSAVYKSNPDSVLGRTKLSADGSVAPLQAPGTGALLAAQQQTLKHHCPQAGASNSTQRRREEVATESLEVLVLFKLLIDGFHHFQFIALIKLDLCKNLFT